MRGWFECCSGWPVYLEHSTLTHRYIITHGTEKCNNNKDTSWNANASKSLRNILSKWNSLSNFHNSFQTFKLMGHFSWKMFFLGGHVTCHAMNFLPTGKILRKAFSTCCIFWQPWSTWPACWTASNPGKPNKLLLKALYLSWLPTSRNPTTF